MTPTSPKAVIIGPNPNELTDDEMQQVATQLHAIAMRVNGTPGAAGAVVQPDELPPVRRYLLRALHTEWQILQAAAYERTEQEGRQLVTELEDFLRDTD